MGRTGEKKDCLAISWHSINTLSNTASDPTRDFCLFTSEVPTERFVQVWKPNKGISIGALHPKTAIVALWISPMSLLHYLITRQTLLSPLPCPKVRLGQAIKFSKDFFYFLDCCTVCDVQPIQQ